MNRQERRTAKTKGRLPPQSNVLALISQASAALDRNDFMVAASAAQAALVLDPGVAEAYYFLGNAKLLQGQVDDAVTAYTHAVTLSPKFAEAHNNLGTALESKGRTEKAAACYRAAVAAQPAYADAHYNLGNILGTLTQDDAAIAAYGKALAARPRYPQALTNLSIVLLRTGDHDGALATAQQAVAIDSRLPESQYNLGNALRHVLRYEDAMAAYRQAIALRPNDADSFIALGNVLQLANRGDEAQRHYHKAHELRPLTRQAGLKSPPDFRVLVLTAPGGGNTPSGYLLGRGAYDSYFLMLMAGAEYDVARLRQSSDVVVNLLSDVDRGHEALPLALDLVERLSRVEDGRPRQHQVINHPRTVLNTGREAVAARLAGIPRLRIPKIGRFSGAALVSSAADALAVYGLPLLVRLSGAHGGEAFEKVADADSVAAFAARNPAADYYVSEYVPYESADGYFRKYRLIFVNGQILPYHLAIDNQWKVHHFRTDMANQEWMRKEEEAFLKDPKTIFTPALWDALRAIQDAIGLDYFGIDCALDQSGDLVVFEVNAAMLIHGERSVFAYKNPYIARIKHAFDEMLQKAAISSPRAT